MYLQQTVTQQEKTAPAPAQVVYHVYNLYEEPREKQQTRYAVQSANGKNRWIALLLCIFLGYLGIHRFYVGKIFSGLIYLLTFGLFGMGIVIDFFLLLFGLFKDKSGNRL